jgi:adenosylhomocysteine nucleosidase
MYRKPLEPRGRDPSLALSQFIKPRVLILALLAEEQAILLHAFERQCPIEVVEDLRMPCVYLASWQALVALGGHGKAQSAVQAQYLIDRFVSAELVVCAGAAGSLHHDLTAGDVVIGTDTVEYDYRLHFASRPLPRFPGHAPSLQRLRMPTAGISGFRVAFGTIASADQDVVSTERAVAIRAQTGALCVAWEGSGTARAATFRGLCSLEVRAITDSANKEAPNEFAAHLPGAMSNLARVLTFLFT